MVKTTTKTPKSTPKIVKVSEEYIPNEPMPERDNSKFSCSWGTFWVALGVIGSVAYGGYSHLKGVISEKIDPIRQEVKVLREEIANNEKNRDKNVDLQIQLIEQKIEVIRVQQNKSNK